MVSGLIGYGMARAIAWAFPRGHVPEYLKAPVLLVAVIGTFVLSNLVQQETGLLAVTVMGIAIANMRLDSLRDIHPFKENVTVLLISGVFVLLSASLDFEVLRLFEWRFAAFLFALLFLVRPATVLIALAFSKLPWNERLLIAWIAPRGVVAVAVSGLFALRLDQLGYGNGNILVTLSFAVVVATIVAHGFSIRHVARWLKVTGATQKGLLIVGSTPWSISLARQIQSLGLPVMIADTSWQRLSAARQAGIETYHGEILAETTEERLDLTQFQVLVATTENEAYNALVCSEFAHDIGRDSVYQLGGSGDDEDHRSLPEALRGRAMFTAGHGVEDILRREAAGWTFRKTRISEQFKFDTPDRSCPTRPTCCSSCARTAASFSSPMPRGPCRKMAISSYPTAPRAMAIPTLTCPFKPRGCRMTMSTRNKRAMRAATVMIGLGLTACQPSREPTANMAAEVPANVTAEGNVAMPDNAAMVEQEEAKKSIIRPDIEPSPTPTPPAEPVELTVPLPAKGAQPDQAGLAMIDTLLSDPVVALGGPIPSGGIVTPRARTRPI